MLASRPVTLCSAEKVEWHHHQRLLQMHIKKQKATITSWFEKKMKKRTNRGICSHHWSIFLVVMRKKCWGAESLKPNVLISLVFSRSSASPSPIWQSSSYESSPGFPQKQTETINFLYENSFRSLYFPTLLVLMAISGHILNTIHSWFCFIRVRKLESCFL